MFPGARDMHLVALQNFTMLTVLLLLVGVATPVLSQPVPPTAARCKQLIDYYDRYGAGRGEVSDGARNMTRIGAVIDCERGDFAAGIRAMEDLLKRKRFDVPPPPPEPARAS